LTLDRSAQTLSGGEGQRIRLATQIGAALVGVLYVLDEPSVGLTRDNKRLLQALRRLVDIGNSVIVVEHDRDAILSADHIVDMGPGAGARGGNIVAEGPPSAIIASPTSVTGPYLSGEKKIPIPAKRKKRDGRAIRLLGAKAHNLRDVNVEIPIGLMTCVTGVSGSGKSSLIVDTLLPAARATLYGAGGAVGPCEGIEGLEHIDKVVSIDQAPTAARRDRTRRRTRRLPRCCASSTPAAGLAAAATRPDDSRSTSRAGAARHARGTACCASRCTFCPTSS
jgi:excinuclease ABC subunit A